MISNDKQKQKQKNGKQKKKKNKLVNKTGVNKKLGEGIDKRKKI
jgi:hypothetical protein